MDNRTLCVDELKTIITLSGSKRLPELEKDVLADKSLTKLYLNNILPTLTIHERIPSFEKIIFAEEELTGIYVTQVTGTKHYTAAGYSAAVTIYAIYQMKAPWTEAEQVILRSAYYSYRYALNFGRWDEAEDVIISSGNSELACLYAIDVIKGPWPEGEALIRLDREYRVQYDHYIHTVN